MDFGKITNVHTPGKICVFLVEFLELNKCTYKIYGKFILEILAVSCMIESSYGNRIQECTYLSSIRFTCGITLKIRADMIEIW